MTVFTGVLCDLFRNEVVRMTNEVITSTDQLQVGRINAVPYFANMVEVHSLRSLSVKFFPNPSVRKHPDLWVLLDKEASVSVWELMSLP